MELAERVDPEEWHRASSIASSRSSRTASTASRAPSTSTPATASWRSSARRSPTRTTPSAPARPRSICARARGARRRPAARAAASTSSVRMGLNSGEVVVGRIGDDLRMDYTAQGHVVGLAARMQQLAQPGGVSVTEHTARLASGFFDLARPRGVRASRARASRAGVRAAGPGPDPDPPRRVTRARLLALRRPRAELALLERALRDARSGRPTVVLVTGEPGAGKSRLCHELAERCPRRRRSTMPGALSHGRMLPFHADRSSWPRGLFGIGEDASAPDIRSAVGRGLASSAARRPDRAGLLARAPRRARSRAGPFGAGARGAPHASVSVDSAI